jgi:hypothetical protein
MGECRLAKYYTKKPGVLLTRCSYIVVSNMIASNTIIRRSIQEKINASFEKLGRSNSKSNSQKIAVWLYQSEEYT